MRTAILLTVLFAAAPALAAEPAAAAGTAAAPTARADREARAREDADRHCLRETGTRIRERSRDCRRLAGRVYTREDLDRTGQVDIASALRMLDTSIR